MPEVQLLPWQQKDCEKICGTANGSYLINYDMGLGKTILALEVCKRKRMPTVILCPNNLLSDPWIKELTHMDIGFCSEEELTDASQTQDGHFTVVLASFSRLNNEGRRKRLCNWMVRIAQQSPVRLVVDEAHCLKNPTTYMNQMVLKLRTTLRDQLHLLLLTATPIVNSDRELAELLTLLCSSSTIDNVMKNIISSAEVFRLFPDVAKQRLPGAVVFDPQHKVPRAWFVTHILLTGKDKLHREVMHLDPTDADRAAYAKLARAINDNAGSAGEGKDPKSLRMLMVTVHPSLGQFVALPSVKKQLTSGAPAAKQDHGIRIDDDRFWLPKVPGPDYVDASIIWKLAPPQQRSAPPSSVKLVEDSCKMKRLVTHLQTYSRCHAIVWTRWDEESDLVLRILMTSFPNDAVYRIYGKTKPAERDFVWSRVRDHTKPGSTRYKQIRLHNCS